MYEIFRNDPGKYTLIDGGLTLMVEVPLSVIFNEIKAMEEDEAVFNAPESGLYDDESIDILDPD